MSKNVAVIANFSKARLMLMAVEQGAGSANAITQKLNGPQRLYASLLSQGDATFGPTPTRLTALHTPNFIHEASQHDH